MTTIPKEAMQDERIKDLVTERDMRIMQLESAGTFNEGIEAAARLVKNEWFGQIDTQEKIAAAIRVLKLETKP